MLKDVMPTVLFDCISKLSMDKIEELRLRVGKPLLANVMGNSVFINEYGECDKENAIIVRKSNIDYILQKASANSLYTINDQLINGYVTIDEGIRIGVCGEIVVSDNKIQTMKNITSLNIRIPHEINNCSLKVFNYLVVNGQVKNTLIISPPGAGKTTFLRDFAKQLSVNLPKLNLLIIDERKEITSCGTYLFDSINGDIYSNCTKEYGFINGIRSMKPDIIITDEINLNTDIPMLENALTSGVKVIATIHASNLTELKQKKAFSYILNQKLFERFVVLGTSMGAGTIEGVYNETMGCLYI